MLFILYMVFVDVDTFHVAVVDVDVLIMIYLVVDTCDIVLVDVGTCYTHFCIFSILVLLFWHFYILVLLNFV